MERQKIHLSCSLLLHPSQHWNSDKNSDWLIITGWYLLKMLTLYLKKECFLPDDCIQDMFGELRRNIRLSLCSKTCVKRPPSKRPKMFFQVQLWLNCRSKGAFCNTFDLHWATSCHLDLCFVYFWVAILHRFYCKPGTQLPCNFKRAPVSNPEIVFLFKNADEELSGRVLDLRSRSHWFETHWRYCVVSLYKTLYPLLSTALAQEMSWYDWKIVD